MNSQSEGFSCERCDGTFTRKHDLKRHIKSRHQSDLYTCNICMKKTFTRKDRLSKHLKICNGVKISEEYQKKMEELTQELFNHEEEYQKTLGYGKMISTILNTHPTISEECLNTNHKLALKAYQSTSTYSMNDVILQPWQEELINHFERPSDRKVLWVVGEYGGEGKTFFQKYVMSLFGMRRAICLDLVKDSMNMFHVLSKQNLTCKDIFLFNLARSVSTEFCSYDTLEGIKDGQCVSVKYNSKILNFRTPNTVMVFSNSFPIDNAISFDRWEMFRIKDNKLVPINGAVFYPPSLKEVKPNFKKKTNSYSSDDSY